MTTAATLECEFRHCSCHSAGVSDPPKCTSLSRSDSAATGITPPRASQMCATTCGRVASSASSDAITLSQLQ